MIFIIYLTMQCPNGIQSWDYHVKGKEDAEIEADYWAKGATQADCRCLSVKVEEFE